MSRLSEERKEELLRRYGNTNASGGPGGMGPAGEGRGASAGPEGRVEP